jgi:hypothetical protein
MHTAATIGLLGRLVMQVNIQAQTTYRPPLLGEHFRLSIEGAEDPASSQLGYGVNTLNPPEQAVAPVGPFIG